MVGPFSQYEVLCIRLLLIMICSISGGGGLSTRLGVIAPDWVGVLGWRGMPTTRIPYCSVAMGELNDFMFKGRPRAPRPSSGRACIRPLA